MTNDLTPPPDPSASPPVTVHRVIRHGWAARVRVPRSPAGWLITVVIGAAVLAALVVGLLLLVLLVAIAGIVLLVAHPFARRSWPAPPEIRGS